MTTWPIQDHADAFLTLLAAAPPASPPLRVFDGELNANSLFGFNPGDVQPADLLPPYALVYFLVETPDGLQAPDAVSLTFDSDVIDLRAYVHSVGGDPQVARAARAVAGRVRAALLNKTLTVANRNCFPIHWRDGQPPQRNEETGPGVFDQVDVYGFRSLPSS